MIQPNPNPAPVETPTLPHPLEPAVDNLLETQDKHGQDNTALLENNLEATNELGGKLDKLIEVHKDQLPKDLMEHLPGILKLSGFINAFFKAVAEKGDPGPKGDKPVRGVDYFTAADINSFIKMVRAGITTPRDGKTPVKGEDYFTPEEVTSMLEFIQSKIPEPIQGDPGEPGKDAPPIDMEKLAYDVMEMLPDPPEQPKELTAKDIIKMLKGKLSYEDLKDLPTIFKQKDIWIPDQAQSSASGTGSGFAYTETPGGAIDGARTQFTLANTPTAPTRALLYLNGQYQTYGIEYTISGNKINYAVAPAVELAGLGHVIHYA